MIKIHKSVSRETYGIVFDSGRRRNVIVTIEPPHVIAVRLKGTRRVYRTTVDALYERLVRESVEAARRDKAKARREQRKARRKTKG